MGKDEHRRRLENTMRNRDIVGEPIFLNQLHFDFIYLVVFPTFSGRILRCEERKLNKDTLHLRKLGVLVIGAAHGTSH